MSRTGDDAGRAGFDAAYDAVLSKWPVPVEQQDVPTPFGRTRVNSCGRPDAPPVLLLHGGGATSTVWFADVRALASRFRVHAPDQVGDAGRSVPAGRAPRSPADLTAWLDAVLDGLGVTRAAVVGHSYGAWLALRWAVHAPERVDRLVLLDPVDVFAPMSLGYRLRAVPLFVRPDAGRFRRFLRWETGGAPLDEDWLHLAGLGAERPRARVVLPRRARRDELARLGAPVLQVLAGRSRALDPARATRAAARALPDVTTRVLPGATHHTMPMLQADNLDAVLLDFLDPGPVGPGR